MKLVTVQRDSMGLFVRDDEACQSFRPRRDSQSITDYAMAVVAAWQYGSGRTVRICEHGQTSFKHGEKVVIQPVLFTAYCRVMSDNALIPRQSICEIWFLGPEENDHGLLQVDQSTVEKP